METILVWVLVASWSSTSQNRAAWVVDDISTKEECQAILADQQRTFTWTDRDGKAWTDVKGVCSSYRKTLPIRKGAQ